MMRMMFLMSLSVLLKSLDFFNAYVCMTMACSDDGPFGTIFLKRGRFIYQLRFEGSIYLPHKSINRELHCDLHVI